MNLFGLSEDGHFWWSCLALILVFCSSDNNTDDGLCPHRDHFSPPHNLKANQLAFISTTTAMLGAGISASHSQWQLLYGWMSLFLQKHGSDTNAQQAIPRAMDAQPQPWKLVPWLSDKPKASSALLSILPVFFRMLFYLMNWKEIC